VSGAKGIGQVAQYRPLAKCGMEELAVRQLSIKPSGGVLFARNVDGEEKSKARQLVVDLFHPDRWSGPLNILTLPGLQWRFERKLLGLREPGWMRARKPRRTHFTGIENDRALYFAATTQMPGLETLDGFLKQGARFPFAEIGVKTRFASFFFADVDDVLRHDFEDFGRSHDRRGWDAAWLDYTGPLSVARMSVIANFFHRFIHDTLIVTALRARWDRATVAAINRAGEHSQWLRQNLPGDVLHDIEYLDTSPMAQFAVRHAGGRE
jgi:hypothetical protein